jgi:hypothetical protein
MLNRLIAFARSEKGQYWINERSTDVHHTHSEFVRYKAGISVDGSDWMRLNAPGMGVFRCSPPAIERCITEDDWRRMGEFMRGNRRPHLVWQLLAGAEEFARKSLPARGTGEQRLRNAYRHLKYPFGDSHENAILTH